LRLESLRKYEKGKGVYEYTGNKVKVEVVPLLSNGLEAEVRTEVLNQRGAGYHMPTLKKVPSPQLIIKKRGSAGKVYNSYHCR
jgi:hypothetical protein